MKTPNLRGDVFSPSQKSALATHINTETMQNRVCIKGHAELQFQQDPQLQHLHKKARPAILHSWFDLGLHIVLRVKATFAMRIKVYFRTKAHSQMPAERTGLSWVFHLHVGVIYWIFVPSAGHHFRKNWKQTRTTKMMQQPWNLGENSMNPQTISGYLANSGQHLSLPSSGKIHSSSYEIRQLHQRHRPSILIPVN